VSIDLAFEATVHNHCDWTGSCGKKMLNLVQRAHSTRTSWIRQKWLFPVLWTGCALLSLSLSLSSLSGTLIDRFFPKNTSIGLKFVETIAARLGLEGVYGPLYSLFEVEDVFKTAVEITAGNSFVPFRANLFSFSPA
jgi:hypothetical protein